MWLDEVSYNVSGHVTTYWKFYRRVFNPTVMSFASIFRTSSRARALSRVRTPPQRVGRGSQMACSRNHVLILYSHSTHQHTLTNTLDPHRNPTLCHRDDPVQGATRTLTTAATAVSSDQHLTTDLPVASAGDRKIAIMWTPQNWSRLYVSL